MNAKSKAYPLKNLIVMTAAGTLDLAASKAALKLLAANPDFSTRCEVLLDLRDTDCAMSTTDIFDLATYMAFPAPALDTYKKVALLVDSNSAGRLAFSHAQFLELCTVNRGLHLQAFESYAQADDWLTADLPIDPKIADLVH